MKHVVVLLGDVRVGKTYFFNHVKGEPPPTSYMTTTSLDMCSVSKNRFDHVNVVLQIWDTPGHKYFQSCIDLVIQKAKCACIFFDTSQQKSYNTSMAWYKRLKDTHECFLIVNDYTNQWSQWHDTISKQTIPFVVIQNAQDIQKPIEYLVNNLNHDSTVIFDKIIASTSSRCF